MESHFSREADCAERLGCARDGAGRLTLASVFGDSTDRRSLRLVEAFTRLISIMRSFIRGPVDWTSRSENPTIYR